MAMGKRRRQQQETMFVEVDQLPRSPGHPFYLRLNEVLERHGFDAFVETLCEPFYARIMGRPSLPPGIYFRLMLIGYFEGLDSERGIAWRAADSFGLRQFLGLQVTDPGPDHSTISRTRRRLDVETHSQVFTFVLTVLSQAGLVKGKTVGIDATTLEANAAMRSICRRDSGESYDEFLQGLAKASGIETPTRADLAKIDRKRHKKGCNEDWVHPHDPEAQITKMKDGSTHLAHKAEHAVDMETGTILAVTLHGGASGDSQTMGATEAETKAILEELIGHETAADELSEQAMSEVVADKGYHSNEVLRRFSEQGIRTYISEPNRGRRCWEGKPEEQAATYANRRRNRSPRGQRLQRARGEKIERSFAHCYETGGMRRLHLRGQDNIRKRLLVQTAGFNLSLLMRKLYSVGKPRVLQGLSALFWALFVLWRSFPKPYRRFQLAALQFCDLLRRADRIGRFNMAESL
jgi:transposase